MTRWLDVRHVSALVTISVCLGTAGCAEPPAGIRHHGLIQLPRSFSSVWYRAGEHLSIVAFSDSGELTVREDAIEFKEKLTIPIADIRSVSWGKLGIDFVNDWATVEYEDAGEIKIAGFKDGGSLGYGGDSDLIYSAIKYAAEVKGGAAPALSAGYFASRRPPL